MHPSEQQCPAGPLLQVRAAEACFAWQVVTPFSLRNSCRTTVWHVGVAVRRDDDIDALACPSGYRCPCDGHAAYDLQIMPEVAQSRMQTCCVATLMCLVIACNFLRDAQDCQTPP